jgi:hypothetical protein
MALEHVSNELLLRVLLLKAAVLAGAEGGQQGHAGRPQLTHPQPVLQDALHEGRPLSRVLHKQGGIFLEFFLFLCTRFNTAAPQIPLEPRTVPLRLRHWLSDALTTRPDLIHSRLDLIHTRLDLIHTRLDLIHTRLDLIHARLDLIHKQVGQQQYVLL